MDSNDVTITPGFATPFVVRRMANPERLNAQLKELFLEREKEGDKWKEPVDTLTLKVKTFESHFELFNWPERCVQKLKMFCFETLGHTLQQVNGNTPEELANFKIYNHTWFHITRNGGYMGTHNHPMASWSGVYCVDDGGVDENNPDSGNLRFLDPRGSTNMFMDCANNKPQGAFATGVRTYRATPGQLVIFPSYIMHDVSPFTADGTRIVVAFNAWVKRRDSD